MRTVANMLEAVKNINIVDFMILSLVDTADNYLEIQKDQLFHGIDSTGSHLSPTYAWASYIKKKYTMNSLPGSGNPDLKLTGAFYQGFKADVNKLGITVYSTDEKAGMLEAKYGKTIYTLFEEWKDEYLLILSPMFLQNVIEAINQGGQLEEAPF